MEELCDLGAKFIAQMARDSVHNNISSLVINSCLDISAET